MKKLIILILIICLCLIPISVNAIYDVTPRVSFVGTFATDLYSCDSWVCGQTFTTSGTSFLLTNCSLPFLISEAYFNTYTSMSIELYAVDGSHLPTGSALSIANFNSHCTGKQAIPDCTWVKLVFTPFVVLSANTEYALVLNEPYVASNGHQAIYWISTNVNEYNGGICIENDGGTSWYTISSIDCSFKIFGIDVPSGGSVANTSLTIYNNTNHIINNIHSSYSSVTGWKVWNNGSYLPLLFYQHLINCTGATQYNFNNTNTNIFSNYTGNLTGNITHTVYVTSGLFNIDSGLFVFAYLFILLYFIFNKNTNELFIKTNIHYIFILYTLVLLLGIEVGQFVTDLGFTNIQRVLFTPFILVFIILLALRK